MDQVARLSPVVSCSGRLWFIWLGLALLFILQTRPAFALTIFTDRSAWESATNVTHAENFESEPNNTGVASFTLPHTTVGGVTITGIGGTSSQQWLANGLVNGSQGPHLRSFSTQIHWSPGGEFDAFGFDFDTSSETWDVFLGPSRLAVLSSHRNGFFGVIDADPNMSFSLRSTSPNQGGISMDNLSFAVIPEPSAPFLTAPGLGLLLFLRNRKTAPPSEN